MTHSSHLLGSRGAATASKNFICFLHALGITAPHCSGLLDILLLGCCCHCCSAGSVSALRTSPRKGREGAEGVGCAVRGATLSPLKPTATFCHQFFVGKLPPSCASSSACNAKPMVRRSFPLGQVFEKGEKAKS